MSKHGVKFPRRLTWEWVKNRYHYCVTLKNEKYYEVRRQYKISQIHSFPRNIIFGSVF